MSSFVVFNIQFTVSLIVYVIIACLYIWPKLKTWSLTDALIPLLLIHTFRTVALGVLVPTLVDPAFPPTIAATIGYGDLSSAILALITIIVALTKSRLVVPLTWLFSLVGTVDLVGATVIGAINEMYLFDLGPQWYVPTYYVPLLMVSQIVIFMLLLRKQPA